MKILIVSQYFWPESFRINDFAVNLKERGHEVTVLTGMPSYPDRASFPNYRFMSPKTEIYQGIEIMRVPLFSRGKGRSLGLILNYLSFVFFAGILGPFRCWNKKFDLIFVFQTSPITSALPAILLKKLKRIPLVLWVQDLWPDTLRATGVIQSSRVLKIIAGLVKFIYKHCDSILLTTKGAQNSLLEMGVAEKKLNYFPNWAEDFYQPKSISKDLQLNIPSGFRVMFAGNLGVSQSLETILQAAKQLQSFQEIQFVILGKGRQGDWLQQSIHEMQLSNIHLLGHKPLEQMPDYFALADALLVTLRKDPVFSLTIPSKIQSYLACGRPIVGAIDGEGATVIRESGAGFAASAQDAVGLANQVLLLYHMSVEQRDQLGRKAREYYQNHFSRNELLNSFENWMRNLIKRIP
jgi:colanic acid biosynthesis glycosyl transferase WcaI